MPRTVIAAVLALAIALAACADHETGPTAPPENAADGPLAEGIDARVALECTADVVEGAIDCLHADDASSDPGSSSPAGEFTFGGQDEYVRLVSSDVCYETGCSDGDPGDDVFQASVTVENLLGQPLATADGATADTDGVRVFFDSDPVVTDDGGSGGAVSVANADATAMFTAPDQPYFQYGGETGDGDPRDELGADGILSTEEVSGVRTWQWTVPDGVVAFEFEVYVHAVVPDEDALSKVALETNTVSAGAGFACAIDVDGRGYCWGDNLDGTLGIGTSGDTVPAPTAIAGGHVWATLAAGEDHACGVTTGGAAYCWGVDDHGQLGNGAAGASNVPALVEGGLSFASIAVDRDFTCGLTTDGEAYCWGLDAYGKIGDGSANGTSDVPVAVAGGHTFVRVVVGRNHGCGLTDGSAILCWGRNLDGQLGDGTTDDRPTPDTIADDDVGGAWADVAARANVSCGITTSGAGYCWGSDLNGQLGDAEAGGDESAPTAIAGEHSFASLQPGHAHSCGVTTDGDALCWGANGTGRLGDGTSTDSETPVFVDGDREWAQLATSIDEFTCGVTTDGDAYCWGRGISGELGMGYATWDERHSPWPLGVPRFDPFTFNGDPLALGGAFSCARTPSDGVMCWGANGSGQLGDGSTDDSTVPVMVGESDAFGQITAGTAHACALDTDSDDAYCWGDNDSGQLGDDAAGTSRTTPVLVGDAHAWRSIDAGNAHTCAVTTDNDAYCWGANPDGRLGDDSTDDRALPAPVVGGHEFNAVYAGGRHTCARTPDNPADVYCWGDNHYFALGVDTLATASSPIHTATAYGWFAIQVGGTHNCGRTNGSGSRCWGRNVDGELGNAAPVDSIHFPLEIDGDHFLVRFALGDRHSCGLTSNDDALCWGANDSGQLGDGTTAPHRTAPDTVSGDHTFESLHTGHDHSCGIDDDGAAWCWGANDAGQLGDGTIAQRSSPVRVLAAPIADVTWATPRPRPMP